MICRSGGHVVWRILLIICLRIRVNAGWRGGGEGMRRGHQPIRTAFAKQRGSRESVCEREREREREINAVFVPLWIQVRGLSNYREGKCGVFCLCPLQNLSRTVISSRNKSSMNELRRRSLIWSMRPFPI